VADGDTVGSGDVLAAIEQRSRSPTGPNPTENRSSVDLGRFGAANRTESDRDGLSNAIRRLRSGRVQEDAVGEVTNRDSGGDGARDGRDQLRSLTADDRRAERQVRRRGAEPVALCLTPRDS